MSDADLLREYRAAVVAGDDTAIAQALAAADEAAAADQARFNHPAAKTGAALYYAGKGVPVFPLQPNRKVPLPGSRGFKDATTDAATIRAWWARTPQANIGAPTGGLWDVIDVDAPHGWWSLAADPGLFDDVRRDAIGRTVTPSGGAHYLVPVSGRGNSTALKTGIDYRGDGGYIVLPPSTIDGRLYRWIDVPEVLA